MSSLRFSRLRGLLALALVGPLAAPAARAANLDEALLRQTVVVRTGEESRTVRKLGHALSELSGRGYKNVGVLPFKVQKGKDKATFVAAPLATSFPARLETALVMMLDGDETKALGIIHDAAGAARRNTVGAWHHQRPAFDKLFATTYRLPWGNKTVKADAFLTGRIVCLDGHKTTVELEVFDKTSLKNGTLSPRRLATFTVENDLALLRDLGFSVIVPRTALARGATAAARDKAARDIVARSIKATARQANAVTPDNLAGMQFALLYNGKKQALTPINGDAKDLFAAPAMPPGSAIALTLQRRGDDPRTLGVVMKVNGKSTWNKEEDVSLNCLKWIYGPEKKGKLHTFEGFYMGNEGTELLKFKVLTEAESATKASELGERAGWIDVDVFASGGNGDKATIEENEMKITLRGLSQAGLAKSPPKTLEALQKKLRQANNVTVKPGPKARTGGLVVHELEPRPSPAPGSAKFPNPVRIGGVSIRYYDKPKANGPLKVTPD